MAGAGCPRTQPEGTGRSGCERGPWNAAQGRGGVLRPPRTAPAQPSGRGRRCFPRQVLGTPQPGCRPPPAALPRPGPASRPPLVRGGGRAGTAGPLLNITWQLAKKRGSGSLRGSVGSGAAAGGHPGIGFAASPTKPRDLTPFELSQHLRSGHRQVSSACFPHLFETPTQGHPGPQGDAAVAVSVRAPCRDIPDIKLSCSVNLCLDVWRGNSCISHAPSTSYSQ